LQIGFGPTRPFHLVLLLPEKTESAGEFLGFELRLDNGANAEVVVSIMGSGNSPALSRRVSVSGYNTAKVVEFVHMARLMDEAKGDVCARADLLPQ
jgi:hypothetical protein